MFETSNWKSSQFSTNFEQVQESSPHKRVNETNEGLDSK